SAKRAPFGRTRARFFLSARRDHKSGCGSGRYECLLHPRERRKSSRWPVRVTFGRGLACFISEMAMSRFGEERASPSEGWLSQNARDEPPSNPRGVIRIACKLYLKNSILHDGAIEQKRQAEDHNERSREPRSERGSACHYDQNPSGISRM